MRGYKAAATSDPCSSSRRIEKKSFTPAAAGAPWTGNFHGHGGETSAGLRLAKAAILSQVGSRT